MDATTLGSVLALAGVLSGSLVAFLGKRGETALSGYNSLTDQLQEERAAQKTQITELKTEVADLRRQSTEKDAVVAAQAAQLAEQASLRAADQAEIARLRAVIMQLGGHP